MGRESIDAAIEQQHELEKENPWMKYLTISVLLLAILGLWKLIEIIYNTFNQVI